MHVLQHWRASKRHMHRVCTKVSRVGLGTGKEWLDVLVRVCTVYALLFGSPVLSFSRPCLVFKVGTSLGVYLFVRDTGKGITILCSCVVQAFSGGL